MFAMRGRRLVLVAAIISTLLILLVVQKGLGDTSREHIDKVVHNDKNDDEQKELPQVKFLPEPTWTPPPIKDPFPALETARPPPVPSWNRPKKDAHKRYGIDYAPPLFIGFTRTWPILLQAVVSYITAGWPPEQICVVENTGVQRANAQGRLTLQNPWYMNHRQLEKLGVKIVQAPVLMNFAQLQNFYTHLAGVNDWPYYFWSHMDVLVLSYEDGMEGVTPKAGEEGYKTVYELCLTELNRAMHSDERWADKFFAYDHLTLVNREAYEEVGGWDTFIPYYMTDCDMHSRLLMHNWTQADAKAGIVTDVGAVLDDLRALYRDPAVEPAFTDPNPPPPPPPPPPPKPEDEDEGDGEEQDGTRARRALGGSALEYYEKLRGAADRMFHHKHGDRGRNTWQLGQQGGQGEPFYYPSRGIAEAMAVLTEAGREVYRRKWGRRDCDLTRLRLEDQWLVAEDWE
ncbi:Uncharacterized protein TPAR_02473 [Tolypocladium paradoxum]|uniref:Glycosyl transferase family 8 protein n=1 Tax=Tolypocladium paradoxum TaxID=94208 RepID=A0A2S4L4D8_9HYPO|nr:Uncharacterized protein TPAR_02473 [Tolypocladium paradoxum]